MMGPGHAQALVHINDTHHKTPGPIPTVCKAALRRPILGSSVQAEVTHSPAQKLGTRPEKAACVLCFMYPRV